MASLLAYSAVFLGAVLLAQRYFRIRAANSRVPPECRPPRRYPHIDPIFGLDLFFITLLRLFQHRHIAAVAERHRNYGHTFRMALAEYATFHTMDSRNIKTVFETKWQDWPVAPARESTMKPFCGRGFITCDGEDWHRFRAMLRPSFSDSNISELTILSEAFDKMLDSLQLSGTTVDLAPRFYELFLDMSGHFILGKTFTQLKIESEGAPCLIPPKRFLEAFHAGAFWTGMRITFGWLGINCPNPWYQSNCETVHTFVDSLVDLALNGASEIKAETSSSENQVSGAPTQSLLSLLVQQTSEPYEIRSQILQVLLASQDCVSSLLSNTVFVLSRHPKAWERLRLEVNDRGSTPLTADALRACWFLQNVIKESLRLYPVFAQMGRTAIRDTILPKGGGDHGEDPIFVPAGCRVIASLYALHRQEDVFGANTDCFDPDRWEKITPQTWEYLPYSGGPRSCAGQELANLQVSFCLARLAQRFKTIESRDHREWAGEWKLTVKNHHGCKVALYSD